MELTAECLVYLYGHLFAEQWEEKEIDVVFGRIPIDARYQVAPLTGEKLSEKSLAEEMIVALFASLYLNGHLEQTIIEERGWDFEIYEKVFWRRTKPLPRSPICDRFSQVFDRHENSILLSRKRRAREQGVCCDTLVASLRQLPIIRTDPYQWICRQVRRYLAEAGLYEAQHQRVLGFIMIPRLQPAREKIASYELAARRLAADLRRLAEEEPELDEVLRDNVYRTLLKMRCDDEYVRDEEGERRRIDIFGDEDSA